MQGTKSRPSSTAPDSKVEDRRNLLIGVEVYFGKHEEAFKESFEQQKQLLTKNAGHDGAGHGGAGHDRAGKRGPGGQIRGKVEG